MMNFLKETVKNYVSGTFGSTSGSSGDNELETWYITAVCAEGIKDKDIFSKSDPYLKIHFGGKTVKTKTINNDRTPQWNETFSYKIRSGHAKDMQLTLMDSDVGLDDKIGTATVSVAELPTFSGEEKYLKVPVFHKQQITGIVHLRVKKIIEGRLSYPQPSGYVQSYSYPYPQPNQIPQQYQPSQPYQQYQVQQPYQPAYQTPQTQQQCYQQPQQPYQPAYQTPQTQQQYYQQPQQSFLATQYPQPSHQPPLQQHHHRTDYSSSQPQYRNPYTQGH